MEDLEKAFLKIKTNKKFQQELKDLLKNYAGRPTPLYYAQNISRKYRNKIYFKREDLLHGETDRPRHLLNVPVTHPPPNFLRVEWIITYLIGRG